MPCRCCSARAPPRHEAEPCDGTVIAAAHAVDAVPSIVVARAITCSRGWPAAGTCLARVELRTLSGRGPERLQRHHKNPRTFALRDEVVLIRAHLDSWHGQRRHRQRRWCGTGHERCISARSAPARRTVRAALGGEGRASARPPTLRCLTPGDCTTVIRRIGAAGTRLAEKTSQASLGSATSPTEHHQEASEADRAFDAVRLPRLQRDQGFRRV